MILFPLDQPDQLEISACLKAIIRRENQIHEDNMAHEDAEGNTHRAEWRELSRNLTQREILYFISGSPDGVREPKIKSFMQDVFKYSFHGSVESHLKELESEGLLTKECPRRGAAVWHANQPRVIETVQKELKELKFREKELLELQEYLDEMYGD